MSNKNQTSSSSSSSSSTTTLSSSTTEEKKIEKESSTEKFPVLFISHGGGPSFFIEEEDAGPLRPISKGSKAAKWFQSAHSQYIKNTPKAILIISAHWETDNELRITSRDKNTLLFDYYGFPSHTYDLKYPASGSPSLAKKICSLLDGVDNGIKCVEEKKRGLDHGVFVPLILMYPSYDIPVVQLSLCSSLDPSLHIAIGERLSSLRNEGVLIIGSGFTTHGRPGAKGANPKAFESWLNDAIGNSKYSKQQRNALLEDWKKAPAAQASHPREEHLIPMMVAAGAAGDDKGVRVFEDWSFTGMAFTNYVFG